MPHLIGIEGLTRRELDCLKAIESLTRNEWPARVVDLAKSLHVRSPSVSELVDHLHGKGMVEKGPGGVRISKLGSKRMLELHRAHRIFESVLTRMGMSREIACRESMRLDRYPSRNLVRTFCTYLGHPRLCPHGVPIEPDPACCRT